MQSSRPARAFLFLAAIGMMAAALGAFLNAYVTSGGAKNEGDDPVHLLLTYDTGDYEWQFLPENHVSLHFSENVMKVSAHEHPAFPIAEKDRVRVLVTLRDGSRKEIRNLGEEIFLTKPGRGDKET